MPAKKLKVNAYISVKKNKAASDPLIIAGCILVTNKKSATGIPPNVVSPLSVPDTIPVKNFPNYYLYFDLNILSLIKKKKILLLYIQINELFLI